MISDAEDLLNLIHREVAVTMDRMTRRQPGKVDSYDPKTHAVKLKLLPESDADGSPVITGWIPLHTVQTGKSAGWHSPPNIGDPGWIEFHEFDREGGTFQQATFNDSFLPDKNVQAGELKYVHPGTQTQIYFDKNGNITIRGQNTSNSNSGNNNNGASGGTNQDNSKQTFVLKQDGSVLMTDRSGNATIKIDGSGNIQIDCVKFTIVASSDVGIKGTGNVEIKGGSNLGLDASGNVVVGGGGDVADLSVTPPSAQPTTTPFQVPG